MTLFHENDTLKAFMVISQQDVDQCHDFRGTPTWVQDLPSSVREVLIVWSQHLQNLIKFVDQIGFVAILVGIERAWS